MAHNDGDVLEPGEGWGSRIVKKRRLPALPKQMTKVAHRLLGDYFLWDNKMILMALEEKCTGKQFVHELFPCKPVCWPVCNPLPPPVN